jgi:ATP-dependent Clp protease adapter protein ClpS
VRDGVCTTLCEHVGALCVLLLLSEGVHLTIVLSESFRSSLLLPLRMSRDNQGLQPQSHSTAFCVFAPWPRNRSAAGTQRDLRVGCQRWPRFSAGGVSISAEHAQRERTLRSLKMADIGRKGPGKIGGKPAEFAPGTGAGAPGGDESGEREREGGGVAVITKTKPAVREKEKTAKEPMWRVLLHNDNIHTFDYVTHTLVKVVKTLTRYKAHRITVHAHKAGVATVTTTWKQLAEEYCQGLQREGLTSSIMPDHSGTQ